MVDSKKLRGWKFDNPDNQGEVFVDGTKVAIFDDATNGLLLPTNGLTINAGGLTITAGALTISASGVAVTGASTFADKITYSDRLIHANAITENIGATITLDAQDVGKILLNNTDSAVVTLPVTALGVNYTIMNITDGLKCTIQPNTADQIYMPDILTDSDNGIVLTAATSKDGDLIRLMADGSVGWYVTQLHGIWAAESG